MAVSKTKLIVVVAVACIALGGLAPGAAFLAGRVFAAQAAPPATSAESDDRKQSPTRAQPPISAATRNALDALGKQYALGDGEVLKAFTPPFPPERVAYFETLFPDGAQLDGYWWGAFRWNGTLQPPAAMVHSSPQGIGDQLQNLVCRIVDCSHAEVEGDEAVLGMGVAGDFVVQDGATVEQVAAALGPVLRQKFKKQVQATVVEEIRPVYVLRGRCQAPAGGKAIELYGKQILPAGEGHVSSSNFKLFVRETSDWIKHRIVSEATDIPAEVAWRRNWRAPYTPELLAEDTNPQAVMDHLAAQTGLSVTLEQRKVWIIKLSAAK